MQDKIQAAFRSIRAEESLKAKTKQAIREKTLRKDMRAAFRWKPVGLALVSLFLCLLGVGGYLSYALPVAAISIDVNPSLELEINRYQRVVRLTGYNDDGRRLVEQLDVQNKSYPDALRIILASDQICQCLQKDNLLEITIAAQSPQAAQRIRLCIAQETPIPPEQIYCTGDRTQAQAAHALGLSLGKYRVFLELQALDPDVSAEEVQSLTMRELRELQSQYKGSGSGSDPGTGGGRFYPMAPALANPQSTNRSDTC